jgi:deoxycytidine triphosphate deaminase
MILSQVNLRAAVEAGQIGFDPALEDRQWGEASVDLRLGFSFTKLEKAPGLVISVADGLGALGRSGFLRPRSLRDKTSLETRKPSLFAQALLFLA